MPQPTIGRTVHYRLSADDVERINYQRRQHPEHAVSTPVKEGDTCPAVVVRTLGDSTTNLRVLLDGSDPILWATSRREGDQPGTWAWPPRI